MDTSEKSTVEGKLYFEKLTPINSADIATYEQALNYVFEEEDLINIAITGTYSAGKSSVLETYKKKNPKMQFIHISLADFEITSSSYGKVHDGDVSSDTILEGKIINQLIHQIQSERIPQTHFKIKRNGSIRKSIGITMYLVILLVSAFFTFFSKGWENYISVISDVKLHDLLFSLSKAPFLYAFWFILVLYLIISIFIIVKIQLERNILKKISVRGMEIEVLEDNKDSYFDKYLNEVLYIFENSKADGIVFEDIDRYDNNRIFTKLREINYLVNRKLQGKKIRFLYLLRDDLFISKDRTKFFDFIIPIVPIVDSSNSLDIFITRFEKMGVLKDFDNYFLQGMALYIDDMRLQKNICNEYIVYSERIKNIELNKDKLLAIMTLKNVFPSEFSQLQLGRGYLVSLFESKNNLISLEIQNIKEIIKKKGEEIKIIKQESLNNLLELDSLFIEPSSNQYIRHNNDKQFSSRLNRIEYLMEHPEEFSVCQMRGRNVRNYSMDNVVGNGSILIKSLENNTEYQTRKALINSKKDNTILEVENDIKGLESKLLHISREKLSEVIKRSSADEVFLSPKLNSKYKELISDEYFPLIKYLVRNGFIDETYPDYMSYFYEKSIKRVDKIYLRSVLDEYPREYTYAIEEPKKVVESIEEGYFRNEALLNNSILEYLLSSWSTKSKILVEQIVLNREISFIWQFFSYSEHKSQFIRRMNEVDNKIFQALITNDEGYAVEKDLLVIECMYSLEEEELLTINNDNCISNYLTLYGNIVSKDSLDIEKIIAAMKLLQVRLPNIDLNDINESLIDGIYRNNLYTIDIDNILVWLQHYYLKEDKVVDMTKITSLIFSKKDEPMTKYINECIDEYVTQIIGKKDIRLNDEREVILGIVNDCKLDTQLKYEFLNMQNGKIVNISNVEDDSLWKSILEMNMFEISGINILTYYVYSEQVITEELIKYINEASEKIDCIYEELEEQEDKSIVSNMYLGIIKENRIDNDKYQSILEGYNHYLTSFSYSNIDTDKVRILIQEGIVVVNSSSINFVRDEYSDLFDYYIASGFDKYIDIIREEGVDDKESILLLGSDIILEEQKVKLLELESSPLSIKDKELPNIVTEYILKHRFSESDLSYFIKKWSSKAQNIKQLIENQISEHIEYVISMQNDLIPELAINVIKANSFTLEVVRKIVLLCLEALNKEQAIEIFGLADESKILSIFEFKRPNIPKSDFSMRVLDYFEKRNWVSKYGDSNEKQGCYKVYTRRKLFK
ncbi:MAG: hypothetical protein K9L62_16380 [Vallitaleaceae bacterium]|nr:hypothetical protein [Vallitaleaceae bacterium]